MSEGTQSGAGPAEPGSPKVDGTNAWVSPSRVGVTLPQPPGIAQSPAPGTQATSSAGSRPPMAEGPPPVAPGTHPGAGPPDKPKRSSGARTAIIAGGVMMGLAILGILVVIADWGMRSYEMNGLLTAIESSEEAMIDARVGLQVLGSGVDPQALSEPSSAELAAELQAHAESSRDDVEAAGRTVAELSVASWHSSVAEARTQYLSHNRAWVAYLDAAAEDPARFFVDYPDIDSTWQSAEVSVRKAVPDPTVFDMDERIESIFEGEPPGQGETLQATGLAFPAPAV